MGGFWPRAVHRYSRDRNRLLVLYGGERPPGQRRIRGELLALHPPKWLPVHQFN